MPITVLHFGPSVEGQKPLDMGKEQDALRSVVGKDGLISQVGSVTLGGFSTAMREAGRCGCDIIIISAHGVPGKIAFSDGIATPAWLALQLKSASPRIVILSTCFSGSRSVETLRAMAEEVSASGIAVVAMSREIEDRAAIVYATEFTRAIVTGASTYLAHQIALEQVQQVAPDQVQQVVFVPAQSGNTDTDKILFEIDLLGQQFKQIAAGHEATSAAMQEIREALIPLAGLADLVMSVVREHGVQQRMLEMLFESQRALLKLTGQFASKG